MAQKSLLAALREYFGFRPGEGLGDFSKEIKALAPADKAYFEVELGKVGYDIVPAAR
jgi:hypothetical protein